MPIYEWICECGNETEEFWENYEPPSKKKCPQCGGWLKKAVSRNNFVLKGQGWPGKELSMGEVVSNEKNREKEFNRKRNNLRRDGVRFPYDVK